MAVALNWLDTPVLIGAALLAALEACQHALARAGSSSGVIQSLTIAVRCDGNTAPKPRRQTVASGLQCSGTQKSAPIRVKFWNHRADK